MSSLIAKAAYMSIRGVDWFDAQGDAASRVNQHDPQGTAMALPLVSVLIPTFNRVRYLGDAVNSALCQTFTDFELVVLDDGSTDGTASLLASIPDPRLRVVRHERNCGISAARNSALDCARGRYIAWLDSDDVARPTRLAEQVSYLAQHPDVAIVGACAGKLMPDGARRRGARMPPLTSELIGAWLLFRSAFQQSAVMGRAEVLLSYRYDTTLPVCEDVDVFQRLHRGGHRMANLPRVLVDRRLHPDQTVRLLADSIRERKIELAAPSLRRLGVSPEAEDLRRHALLGKTRLDGVAIPPDFLAWTRDWMRRLHAANRVSNLFDDRSLSLAAAYFWAVACSAASPSLGRARAALALAASPPLGLIRPTALGWMQRLLVAK